MRTVVVVDDEPIIRLDLSQMMEALGYRVTGTGADGFDAVEICKKKRPDIVLLDLEMPVFDGFMACRSIVEEELAGCVVIATAFMDDEFVRSAVQAGASGYLVKPIEERMLGPALEVAWEQSRRLREVKLEAGTAKKKLEDSKIIERAKGIIAKQNKIPEAQAYRMIQETSMKKGSPMVNIARLIISQEGKK